MKYVERNPVRAGLVQLPWDYPWSSAAAHLGQRDFFGLLDLGGWRKEWSPQAWRDYLLEGEEEKQLIFLRHCTRTGKPFASDEFNKKLSELQPS